MRLLGEEGIGSGIHFRAVHGQKHYRDSQRAGLAKLGNTEWNSDRICSLPLFPGMTDYDVDRVVEAVRTVLDSVTAG